MRSTSADQSSRLAWYRGGNLAPHSLAVAARHINFLGPLRVHAEPGRLRPLRDPGAKDEEEDEAVA
jgi:hypothetical protein